MKNSRQSGFTLVEILIAVVILALSLTTLLGLQSASFSSVFSGSRRYQALLMSRTLMTAVERGATPEIQNKRQNAFELLQVLMSDPPPIDTNLFKRTDTQFIVEYWNLPGIIPNSLKRVTLRVYWGPKQNDFLETSTFTPSAQDEDG